MVLDVADTQPLIFERSDRWTELQIPTMLALLFVLRGLWRRRNSYCNAQDGQQVSEENKEALGEREQFLLALPFLQKQ